MSTGNGCHCSCCLPCPGQCRQRLGQPILYDLGILSILTENQKQTQSPVVIFETCLQANLNLPIFFLLNFMEGHFLPQRNLKELEQDIESAFQKKSFSNNLSESQFAHDQSIGGHFTPTNYLIRISSHLIMNMFDLSIYKKCNSLFAFCIYHHLTLCLQGLNGKFCRGAPSEAKQNEVTETCEGSKQGFLGMPDTTRPFPDGYHMYFMCIDMSIGSQSLRTDQSYHTHTLAFMHDRYLAIVRM